MTTTGKTPDGDNGATDATATKPGDASEAVTEATNDIHAEAPAEIQSTQATQPAAAQDASQASTDDVPRPMPAAAQMPSAARDEPARRNQRGPVARFFRSVFSHLLFAGVVVAGVLGYLYHAPILRDVGDTVCSDKALGQWMTVPPGTSLASGPRPEAASKATPTPAAASSDSQNSGTATSEPASSTAKITKNAAPSTTAPAERPAERVKAAPTPVAPVAAAPTPVVPAASTPAPASSVDTPASKPDTSAAPASAEALKKPDTTTNADGGPKISPRIVVTVPIAAQAPATAPAATSPTAAAPSVAAPSAAPPAATVAIAPVRERVATPPSAPSAAANNAQPAPAHQQSATTVPADRTRVAVQAPSNVAPTSPPPDTAAPTNPREQMLKDWSAAREAFSKGKPEAVTLYLDLVKRFPDVPELAGELGNIYYQKGNMAEAAVQYYETAQRLIRLGQPGPAACLIDVMRYLDADKAKALEAQTNVACPVQNTQRN